MTRSLKRCLALDDFEHFARRRLPHPLFEYIRGGSETGATLRNNAGAFQAWGFLPRVMHNVAHRSTATSLLGDGFTAPFGIAPMGISALMAYRGDIALAQAAKDAGIPMIMSGSSLIPLEDVAAANPHIWFQAYLPGEPERILALVDRVAAAGIGTLVVTVDTAALANREHNIRAGFTTPLRPGPRLALQGALHPVWSVGTLLRTLLRHGLPHFENSFVERGAPILSRNVMRDFRMKGHLDWSHIALIRDRWRGKLIIKGVTRPEDAEDAVKVGAEGIIVSNHGGRQLDGTIAPLQVLPDVRSAVGKRAAVMLDGSVRRGSDVLKAIALGADFVFVGRPFLYAATIGGKAGVTRAAEILHSEVDRNIALLGVNNVEEIGPHVLARVGAGAV
ncbi:alpha-hydroxy acid oxidase [Paracoccus laeviglucosivorans]|uniref:L-lactate dehydrogenase (Cytochrome) n=1 Tax=Paracoccus laeviglucosivorans TaxID=1197861 RepID=A0A521ENB3_9RHOB|nr:alpha-hydroxy acid oxidase [Paracoccus laeviglucosivorans]SMO85427.1 L-lactate dehydrogenase (cytochrome) [Paracoccus laeviglucosivorans]